MELSAIVTDEGITIITTAGTQVLDIFVL